MNQYYFEDLNALADAESQSMFDGNPEDILMALEDDDAVDALWSE